MSDPDTTAAVGRGMRAQLAQRNAEMAGGAHQVGWKIGFNAPAIQEHFGLTHAVVGYLLDTGVVADGATVSLDGWDKPAVEVEVAVRVGVVGGGVVVTGLAPALELVDLGIPFDDIEPVLAANICQRGVVFGGEVAGLDPFAVSVAVTKNGEPAGEGSSSRIRPRRPPSSRRSFPLMGPSSSGQRIIAGSLTPPVSVAPGDQLAVTFGPLARLSVSSSDQSPCEAQPWPSPRSCPGPLWPAP